jgi:hypothetical protein
MTTVPKMQEMSAMPLQTLDAQMGFLNNSNLNLFAITKIMFLKYFWIVCTMYIFCVVCNWRRIELQL